MTPPAWPARRLLIAGLLWSMPAIAALHPVVDPDVWWHLRVGEWIVEQWAVPWTDHFSQYGMGRPWIAYNWLFEVLLYGLWRPLGLHGVLLYQFALSYATAFVLHRLVMRGRPGFAAWALLMAVGLGALGAVLRPRSYMFSILFFLLVLHVLAVARESGDGRLLRWLPLVFVVWANVHIQYIYGLFMVGAALFEALVYRVARPAWLAPASIALPTRTAALLLAACVAATFLTPYHVYLQLSVLEVMLQGGVFNLVTEHMALQFRSVWEFLILGLILAAIYVLGRRGTLQPFQALVFAMSVFLAFRSMRDVWVATLVSVAVLSAAATRGAPAMPRRRPRPRQAVVVAAVVALVTAATAWHRDLSAAGLERTVAATFPVQAAATVEARGYDGPLYNYYDWGGYLIWRLPRLPVAMDGRTNLHGDRRIERSILTWAGGPGWATDPELAAASVVIAPTWTALASLLRLDDRFQLAHEDDLAVVFIAAPAR